MKVLVKGVLFACNAVEIWGILSYFIRVS